MIIKKLTLQKFGSFTDWELLLPDQIAVVLGSNEGGKSTLFAAISVLLFGFDPVKSFPYLPFSDETEAIISAEIEVEGRMVEVYRRLRNGAVTGHYISGGSRITVNNNPLPFATVGRDFYRNVYHLRLADMASLDKQTWEKAGMGLLGGGVTGYIRPAGEVNAQLEKDRMQLYSTRAKTSLLRVIDEQIQSVTRLKREAQKNERLLQEEMARQQVVDSRVIALKEEVKALEAKQTKLHRLLQFRDDQHYYQILKGQAGDPALLSPIPEGCEQELNTLNESIAEADDEEQRLLHENQAKQREKDGCTTSQRALINKEKEVRQLVRAHGQLEAAINNRAARKGELPAHEADLAKRAAVLFKNAHWRDGLAGMSLDRVKAFCSQYRTLQNDENAFLVNLRENNEPKKKNWLLPVTVALAVVSIGLAFLVPVPAILLFAASLTAAILSARNRKVTDIAGDGGRLSSVRKEKLEVGATIVSILEDAGVDSVLARGVLLPGSETLQALSELKEHLLQIDRLRQEIQRNEAFITDIEGRAIALSEACFGTPYKGDLPSFIAGLQNLLEQANHTLHISIAAEERCREIEDRLLAVRQKRDKAQGRITDLAGKLQTMGGLDIQDDIQLYRQRRDSHIKARAQYEKLRQNYEDYDELLAIPDEELPGDGEVGLLKETLEEMNAQLGALREERGQLSIQINTRTMQMTPSDLEGEMQALIEQKQETERRYDRISIIGKLVKAAERRFREENQPALLKNAGQSFETITAGRYTTLALNEETGLLEARRKDGVYLPVKDLALSQGTLEQLYFCLRAALLSESEALLPLLLDEALVNWDEERRKGGLAMLHEIAKRQQVIVFTCHPSFAQEVANTMAASTMDGRNITCLAASL